MRNVAALCAGIALFFCTGVLAQNFQNDTLFVQRGVQQATKQYADVIQGQLQLYNGSLYADYQPTDEEHPYFLSDDWVFGSVFYDGNLYRRTPLLYNTFKDQLITEHYYTSNMITLVKSKVKYFTTGERTFMLLTDPQLPEGFYEVLYDGNTKAFVKHIKALQERIEDMAIHHEFLEKTKYYIYKNGTYTPVASKKSVLKVLGEKKREVNQFMNKNKIRFRKNREQYITKAVEFYDQH